MKLLGVVQDMSHDGKLIVKSRFAPMKGSIVRDNVKARVGKVVRVFGPVRSPYVAVQPEEEMKTLAILGREVYIEEGDDGKGKRGN